MSPMNPRLLRPMAIASAGDPFATLVSTKSTGDIEGYAMSTTGYIKVEWWDTTSNVYGTGGAEDQISWSKAAGGAGSKTVLIYPSDSIGNLDGSLTSLACMFNSVTSLDVSGLTALTSLNCAVNSVTSLDVSGLTALTSLFCYNNAITSLRAAGVGGDIYGYTYTFGNIIYYISGIQAQNNSLSAEALDQFYTDLATTTSGIILVSGNPGTTGDDPTIATAKGWTAYGS